MERLILNYIENPRSAKANFELAEAYEKINHYAGAASHFLRCAEWGQLYEEEDMDYVYESLIHISLLLGKLKDRTSTEEGWLLHAINYYPDRSEAYWLMSQLYERQGRWHEAYTMAQLGLQHPSKPLHIDIGFEEYMLIFQKAVAAWWIGRTSESRELFFNLPEYELNEKYQNLVQINLSSIGGGEDAFVHFDKNKLPQLRYKFAGWETIDHTFGQVYQDLFVLSMTNGKKKGYYLEIGSADPYLGSNTALLEKQFGWTGISIEYNETLVKEFRKHRANPVICKDATIINYDKLLRQENAPLVIDYLQLDCEPPKTTYEILLSIPFERYKFAVITFEHDHYADVSRKYRELSRQFLKDQGYVMVVGNVGRDERCPFEDWWVHPDLVDKDIIREMEASKESVVMPEQYFFPNKKPSPKGKTKKLTKKIDPSKLEGFPVVNWITLEDSVDRQEYMREQFKKYNLRSVMHIAEDGRKEDFMNSERVIIQKFSNTNEVLDSGGVATALSHIQAIKDWAYDTEPENNDPYGLFVEDDITFETIDQWNFTWKELIDKLPKGWKIIQLSVIKNRDLTNKDMVCEWRCWDNWSAFAYIIDREYAKELCDNYIEGNHWNFVLKYNLIPFPENIIYGPEREGIYTLPLFTENNNKFISTFYPDFIKGQFKAYQKESSDFILKWWEDHKNDNQLDILFK